MTFLGALQHDRYQEFLKAKACAASSGGLPCERSEIHPALKPHQKDIVQWMVRGGRRACFASFGMGKTTIQLEAMRLILSKAGGRGLIVLPLGVKQEFEGDDAKRIGVEPRFIRRIEEADETGIYLTNYETVRDGKLDPRLFAASSLDEANILRGFGGTKTFREFMALFAGDRKTIDERVRGDQVRYRFVATATPDPNEYLELLAYAAYLDIMPVSDGKTRFFKRDSTKADRLTLLPHKEEEFWLWVASWAIFVQKPSDLGHSDEGYDLPPADVRWHELPTDHRRAGFDRKGQGRLYNDSKLGVSEAAREKRQSLPARIAKMRELLDEDPESHFLLWHDREDERKAIEKAVPEAVSVYGRLGSSKGIEERERRIIGFSEGEVKYLATKPVLSGSGCNFQKHCHRAIYLGIGFKFAEFIQSFHRIYRFLQQHRIRVDLIYTEAERGVREVLERKWKAHNEQVSKMTELIREHGLAHADLAGEMAKGIGVERRVSEGKSYRLVNEDAVLELDRMESDSVGLIATSPPFSMMYQYCENYADMGHCDNNSHFMKHLEFAVPNMFRVLKPGRMCVLHVKDRNVPGGMRGWGFQTVYPFHAELVRQDGIFAKAGFAYMGMVTVVTDVVRENNQTYRLGWTEQCKDGTKMGAGMPEYLLLFRKPPTDRANGYADEPVIKSKEEYSRNRWQVDAHGFWRSNGDRPIRIEELEGQSAKDIFRLFRRRSLEGAYCYENHVELGNWLEEAGRLPKTFMLLQPASWHPDVWTDVARMRTMNTLQAQKGRVAHVCPLQFDIAERIVTRLSNPGDIVLDPFGGLMTVPMKAVEAGRFGMGIELSTEYWADGAAYCAAAERKLNMPTLFELVEPTQVVEEASLTS